MTIKTATPIDRHVGARIRTQRMMRGVSQTELGTAVGVSFQQVQKYENGSPKPHRPSRAGLSLKQLYKAVSDETQPNHRYNQSKR